MKEGITSLDLSFLIKELRERIVGSRIRNIKQVNEKFIFELYNNKKKFFLNILPNAIYITQSAQKATKPSDFCMQLRKYLLNKIISKIDQHEFDRIVELEINGYGIVFELFSNGNIILKDSSNIIIGVLKVERWRTRFLKPKERYGYPPETINPFKYKFMDFMKLLRGINKPIVKALAKDFGLGGTYAEEFCNRLKIDKNKNANRLEQNEMDRLHILFQTLESETKPSLIMQNGKQSDAVPIQMTTYKSLEKIDFDSFNKTIAAYFEGLERIEREREEEEVVEREQKRMEKIKEKQMNQLEELEKKERINRQCAELLYKKYHVINSILQGVQKLREEGRKWEEIENIIKSEDTEESRAVKELKPGEAKLVLVIDRMSVEIDFRKSIEENANEYFEEAKKIKEKIKGLMNVLGKLKIKPKPEIERKEIRITKKWYERYRWFFTSNNILVVAGKNARNNETIIKRYVREQDLVLHADIHGSPFAVIRNDQKLKTLPAESIYEAAELVASYSRAWLEKMASIPVYYIGADQVVKEPGLPLGSFRIKGERGWLEKIKPRLSIAVRELENFQVRLIYGPPTAVKKQTPYLVTIVPGDISSDQLAKEIKKQLIIKVPAELKSSTEGIDVEEIKKIIPYGKGQLVS